MSTGSLCYLAGTCASQLTAWVLLSVRSTPSSKGMPAQADRSLGEMEVDLLFPGTARTVVRLMEFWWDAKADCTPHHQSGMPGASHSPVAAAQAGPSEQAAQTCRDHAQPCSRRRSRQHTNPTTAENSSTIAEHAGPSALPQGNTTALPSTPRDPDSIQPAMTMAFAPGPCATPGPPWHQQLTLRGFCVAVCLGILFCIITIKLNLGSAGMTPPLNIAGGLLSFVLLKTFTQLSTQFGSCGSNVGFSPIGCKSKGLFGGPFTPQENAVVQTMTSACYSLAGYSGFGSYLLAMGYNAYLNLGGVAKGQPGYHADTVIDPTLQRVYPYLALIAFAGIFALLGLRNLMILTWRLPYPSGTAAGMMINSLHMQAEEASAATHKVKLLGFTALGSFLFDLLKWFFQGPDYRCGFSTLPIPFGRQAALWTFHFDFQIQYIGAGMLVPPIVAWSMMFGAVLSWGIMWPRLAAREGDWYPSGLSFSDMKGLAGYKIWLSVALLLGEGLYMLGVAALLGYRHARAHYKHCTPRAGLSRAALLPTGLPRTSSKVDVLLPITAQPDIKDATVLVGGDSDATTDVLDLPSSGDKGQEGLQHCSSSDCAGQSSADAVSAGRGGDESGWAGDDGVGGHDDHGVAGIAFKESRHERVLREAVFRSSLIPWWLGPGGYMACALLGIAFIPMIYTPAKWYMVLVAFLLGPPIALANSYGAGLTDQDNGANYATLALFLFAAWAGTEGNGIIAGCVLMGVIMVCAVNAAVLMQDLRTAYITGTSPASMFAGQVIGTALGVVFAPLVFYMFWQTGLVGVKEGPYPNPWADVSRGMAIIGTEGLAALPRYCGVLSAAFFVGGLLICSLRDLLPKRYGRFVPSPMGIAFSFYIGANNAIDFFVGSLLVLAWEWRRPQAALQLGPLMGAGLIVGDGLWAIPSALLAIGGVAPPVCLQG